jgi:hypothetical protein
MRTFVVVAILVVAGCKSKSNPEAPPPSPKKTETAKDPMHDIAKQPRTPATGKTAFLEYTIELPNWEVPATVEAQTKTWKLKSSKLAIEVSESGELPSDSGVASARRVQLPATEGTRTVSEEPGAYWVVEHRKLPMGSASDPVTLEVEYCRDLDPKEPPSGICCKVTAEEGDDMETFALNVCRSIQVKNRKTVVPAAPPSGSAAK